MHAPAGSVEPAYGHAVFEHRPPVLQRLLQRGLLNHQQLSFQLAGQENPRRENGIKERAFSAPVAVQPR